MTIHTKANKIVQLLKDDSAFLGLDVLNDKITVFVSSTYLAKEIKEPFQEILNVNVVVGKKLNVSNRQR